MDEEIYKEMLEQGLILNQSWLQRAIEVKHPRLSIGLAHSELLMFDKVDMVLGTQWDYGIWEICQN